MLKKPVSQFNRCPGSGIEAPGKLLVHESSVKRLEAGTL